MAGYVFSIGSNSLEEARIIIKECVESGVYSTFIKSIKSNPYEGTLADYLSMKEGDNVYFFSKRKYFGIGEIVNVDGDCKYCNYIDSTVPLYPFQRYEDIKNDLLLDKGIESSNYKWICTFKASPYFFEEGIDVDEVLNYKPHTFKVLRSFWKLSFIKIDDEENESLKEIMLLRHQKEISSGNGIIKTKKDFHEKIAMKRLEKYSIEINKVLRLNSKNNRITHEMALEAATIKSMVDGSSAVLGKWDYVSHQVVASPFKPIDYMDKIDIFAYRYISNTKIPQKYFVAELKKDLADKSTVDQVMKYVDWVSNQYAYGDYGRISACIIAYEFENDIEKYIEKSALRHYSIGSHPIENYIWNDIRLISYTYIDDKIEYTEVYKTDK